jgi:hypothetical protein
MKTTSYETSKKLKELGVHQFTANYWVKSNEIEPILLNKHNRVAEFDGLQLNINSTADYIAFFVPDYDDKFFEIEEKYAAYTLDEILEILPAKIHDCCYLELCKTNGTPPAYSFGLYYRDLNDNDIFYGSLCINPNPAEAAGQLLVWCIKNGYVNPEELNQKENNDEK